MDRFEAIRDVMFAMQEYDTAGRDRPSVLYMPREKYEVLLGPRALRDGQGVYFSGTLLLPEG